MRFPLSIKYSGVIVTLASAGCAAREAMALSIDPGVVEMGMPASWRNVAVLDSFLVILELPLPMA
jgi:hypothetical protein